jgi:hypothetical protein
VNIIKRRGFSAKFAEPAGFDWLDSSRLDLDPLDGSRSDGGWQWSVGGLSRSTRSRSSGSGRTRAR